MSRPVVDEVIQVAPLGWKDGSYEPEHVNLSEMDHTMPRIYALIAEVFELPQNVDKDTVAKNLCKGLEYALTQFPPVAGALHMDEKDGRLCKRAQKSSTVGKDSKSAGS